MIEKRTPSVRYLLNITGVHPVSFRMLFKCLLILSAVLHIVYGFSDNGTSVGDMLQRLPATFSSNSAAQGSDLPCVYDLIMDPKNLGVEYDHT